jgi:hypothetical protein
MVPRLALVVSTSVLAVSAGLSACEQRYSGDAPPAAPTGAPATSSSAGLNAVLAIGAQDAGTVGLSASHAMTVTNCAWPTGPCAGVDIDASAEGSYRVVFGSGRASIRSRGQAMADLYREMRDKTSAGQRLDLEPHTPGAADASAGPAAPHASNPSGSDPITQSAFVALDLVDAVGEVNVDVVYGTGADGCLISLGRAARGGQQCLVHEPERAKRINTSSPGMSW